MTKTTLILIPMRPQETKEEMRTNEHTAGRDLPMAASYAFSGLRLQQDTASGMQLQAAANASRRNEVNSTGSWNGLLSMYA